MVWALLAAALAGAAMSFQGAFNSSLSRKAGLLGASAAVHVIGAILTGLVIAGAMLWAKSAAPNWTGFGRAAWWAYLGGVLSVLIIAGVAFAFPIAGAGLSVSTIITAQLAAAVVLDHFGLFETTRIPITWVRLLGVALLVVGTRLVAK